jgi:hypothetical protein
VKYQLVLQFRGDTLADYDAMVALEGQLSKDLGLSAKVDGHDCGSGETNIFIHTSEPERTFWRVRHTLQNCNRLQSVTAAYRPIDGEDYTVLWPEGAQIEFAIK